MTATKVRGANEYWALLYEPCEPYPALPRWAASALPCCARLLTQACSALLWCRPANSKPALPCCDASGVVEDLQALFTEHRIFMIHNPETDRTALFPAELEGVSVDEDIITQYHEVGFSTHA